MGRRVPGHQVHIPLRYLHSAKPLSDLSLPGLGVIVTVVTVSSPRVQLLIGRRERAMVTHYPCLLMSHSLVMSDCRVSPMRDSLSPVSACPDTCVTRNKASCAGQGNQSAALRDQGLFARDLFLDFITGRKPVRFRVFSSFLRFKNHSFEIVWVCRTADHHLLYKRMLRKYM